MSYSIYIGERILVDKNHRDYDPETGDFFSVQTISNLNAPVFIGDEFTGNTNTRSPAYSVWYNFVNEVGLYNLFFNKVNGLMKEHPGIASITNEHLAIVTDALIERRKNNSKEPGFSLTSDRTLARLIWLEWWMKHALQTCINPSIYNL